MKIQPKCFIMITRYKKRISLPVQLKSQPQNIDILRAAITKIAEENQLASLGWPGSPVFCIDLITQIREQLTEFRITAVNIADQVKGTRVMVSAPGQILLIWPLLLTIVKRNGLHKQIPPPDYRLMLILG